MLHFWRLYTLDQMGIQTLSNSNKVLQNARNKLCKMKFWLLCTWKFCAEIMVRGMDCRRILKLIPWCWYQCSSNVSRNEQKHIIWNFGLLCQNGFVRFSTVSNSLMYGNDWKMKFQDLENCRHLPEWLLFDQVLNFTFYKSPTIFDFWTHCTQKLMINDLRAAFRIEHIFNCLNIPDQILFGTKKKNVW